jgi:trimeric autotransporter adhesin
MKLKFYTIRLLGAATFSVVLYSTTFAQISGTVFRDINNDGVRQSINPSEPGEFGVIIKAYNALNVLVASKTTNGSGGYSFSAAEAPAAGLPVRLEFIINPGDQPSKRVNANGTNIQFVSPGPAAANVDFAVASKKTFSDNANPYIATTAFTNGNANSSGMKTAGDKDNLYIFPYDLSNDGGTTRRAKNQYLGSVFGLAWQRESRVLFMSAYLKRHSGFGPGGIGAIYQSQISTTGIPATPSLLVNVGTIGINVGTDPRIAALPDDPKSPNTDVGVFAEIGKRGIGGIDISNDGKELYIVNMFEKKLHRINIGNPLKSSFSSADVTGSWVIPNPGLAGTIWRPMAVKVQNDKIYVGGVTVRETTGKHDIADTANMRGVVYEFNPSTNLFTEVLRFPLSHRRGFSNNDHRYEFRNNYWSAWQNNGDISLTAPLRYGMNPSLTPSKTWPSALYYAQPMLCNIEFDIDGSMILGIRDRFGDQGGYANLFETGNEPGETYRTISSGEVLKAGKTGAAWVLENNGSVTNNGITTTTPGSTDNNPAMTGSFAGYAGGDTPWGGDYGPGGGYFYYNHNFSLTGVPAPFNTPGANQNHYLKSSGGLAVYPGYNEVMFSAMDPINKGYSSGILRNFNSGVNAGNMSGRSELIVDNAGDPSGFGKAGALGDLVLLLDAQSMEIGNRVWYDAVSNGIQDSHEPGIIGVVVILRSPGLDKAYGTADDQTWSRTTDANGNYFFDETVVNDNRRPASWLGVSATNSGILPGFEYRVEINPAQTALTSYSLAVWDLTNDAIDSDGQYSGGMIQYVINPGGSGAASSSFNNNYNVDFGFYIHILSVNKLDFTPVLKGENVELNWSTTEELSVNKYHIERSFDGTSFTEIGSVLSKGDGDFSYIAYDNKAAVDPKNSSVFYRLRIEDKNGAFNYSETKKINFNKLTKLQISPNPFTDLFRLNLNASKRSEAVINIVNAAGQQVYYRKIALESGANIISLDNMQKLSKGLYVMQIQSGGEILKHKLIKQ